MKIAVMGMGVAGSYLMARLKNSEHEVVGYERRPEFKNGAKNISTTFTYSAMGYTQPHKWNYDTCEHLGWLKTPGTSDACESVVTLNPVPRNDILVLHKLEDGTACAWDDVSGNELDSNLTLK